MPKKSSIPADIQACAPCKCCRIRKDGNIYRVYKYHAIKLENGKWSNNYGDLIGKIIPGVGFCPNKKYQELLESNDEPGASANLHSGITDLCYGNYALLIFLSLDVFRLLGDCFSSDTAAQIYCYAIILCANGFLHIDQINEKYIESIMSLMFENFSFKMGYTALSNLLHRLGSEGGPVHRFEQHLIDSSSKDIAIDGHVIRSCSQENDLAEPGYKTRELKSPQVNVLIAYDTKNRCPLVIETFRGSSVDKKSVISFLEARSFKNVKFIVDRGFYSSEVLKMMSIDGNSYIIPLLNTTKIFKRIKENLSFSSGEFVYNSGKRKTSRIIYYEEKIDDKTRVIVYKDIDENNSKRKSYLKMMDLNEKGYTKEGYDEYKDWWGVYFLETTTEDTAAEVFSGYKGRWSIETYNDYLKNDAAFVNLKIQDYYVQHGLDFIMLVTGLIYVRLRDAVNSLEKSNLSTYDILSKSGHMRMVLETNNVWKLRNTRTMDLEELNKMGFIPLDVINSSEELLRKILG